MEEESSSGPQETVLKKLRSFEDLNCGLDPQRNIGFLRNILAKKNAYPFLSHTLLADFASNAIPTGIGPPWLFKKILGLRIKYLASLRSNILAWNSSFNSPEEEEIFNLSDTIWGSDSIDNSANCLEEIEILDRMIEFRKLNDSACRTDYYSSLLEFLKTLPRSLDPIAVTNRILNLQMKYLALLQKQDDMFRDYSENGKLAKSHMIRCIVKEIRQNSTHKLQIYTNTSHHRKKFRQVLISWNL
ncbi:hypothetical protein ACH5RR_021297 [Cinchona calisaya]|uniref:Uncharacterized protein n=1 Tax=Cinchona calisaya TaxID=153742 RepID=A0ABD2ZI56_9GENT